MLQAVQLLLCDWLLATRTELWEMSQPGDKGDKPATQMELIAFQQDLSSLRKLSQINKAALPKVSSVIVILAKKKFCSTFQRHDNCFGTFVFCHYKSPPTHIHSQALYVVEHFSESFTFGMENYENDWSGEMEREIYKIKV